jgi:hypothetical protein
MLPSWINNLFKTFVYMAVIESAGQTLARSAEIYTFLNFVSSLLKYGREVRNCLKEFRSIIGQLLVLLHC